MWAGHKKQVTANESKTSIPATQLYQMDEIQNDWQTRKSTCSEQNQFLLEHSLWTDCVFIVSSDESEKQIFRCHKLLLSKSSAVFAAMLNGPLAKDQDIYISDISPQVFRLLLQFIYTGEISSLGNVEVASGLCYAANKYMIPQLTAACLEYLEDSLAPDNVCYAYELAKLMDYRNLEDKCFKMIQERTKEVIRFSSFEDIQISTLFEIVRQDTLMLYSESRLIKASFRWAEKELVRKGMIVNGPNLRNILGPVLSRLRFLALTTKEFADCPARSDILTSEEKVAMFIKISSPAGNDIKLSDVFCNLTRDRNRPIIAVPSFLFGQERYTILTGSDNNCKDLQSFITFLVNMPVLLVGVEIPTQDRPEYVGTTYWESVDVTLQDSSYDMLSLATFRHSITYNSIIEIKFPNPVTLNPDIKYKLSVMFQSQQGFYRKGNGMSKATNQNIFLNESKVAISFSPTYIRSLIYKKK